jgi:hypothetical protein
MFTRNFITRFTNILFRSVHFITLDVFTHPFIAVFPYKMSVGFQEGPTVSLSSN